MTQRPQRRADQEAPELKRMIRFALGWVGGTVLILLGFLSLFRAPLAALIFGIMASSILPPVRERIDGMGKMGRRLLGALALALFILIVILGS